MTSNQQKQNLMASILATLKQQLKIQYYRYSTTIPGKLTAILLYLIIFISSQQAMNFLVPFLDNFLSQKSSYVFIISGTIAFNQLLWGAGMWIVYRGKYGCIQKMRYKPDMLWPWQSDRKKWNVLLWRSIKITAFNVLIFTPVNLLIEANIDFRVIMDPLQSPALSWLIPQIFLMMLIQDFLFFTLHYLLHSPLLYPIHKIHHQFTTSVSIAGLHFHIVEFFLIQSLSALINIRLTILLYGPIHISTLVSWFVLRIWDANIAHSGYNFTWAPIQLLPFCTNQEFHDFHHQYNSGNYGSHFRIWDRIFGTNQEYHKYKLRQIQENAKILKRQ